MQSRLNKSKKQSVPHSYKYTSDFDSVIYIVVWNSLGLFFVDFILVYMISQVWNGSGIAIGLYPAFLTFGGLVSSPFIGYLADHVSKQKLVMMGAFGRGLSYFGFYFSIILQSLLGIYLSSILLGLGAMLFWVPFDTLISEKSSKYHRSSAFGRRRFAMGIGQVIGAVFGLSIFGIASYFTPNNIFVIYCAIPLFGVANFYAGIKFFLSVDEKEKFQYPSELNDGSIVVNEQKVENISSTDRKTKLYLTGVILLFTALILNSINVGIYRPFILPIVFKNTDSPASIISWFFLPATLVSSLIAPKLGKIADNANAYLILSITSILGGLTTWVIVFLTTNLWILAILIIIDNTIMLTSSFVFMNFLSRVSEKHRGKIFGLITTFDSLGYVIGPILGGLVYDISFATPFIISILVEWSLIPFFIFGMRILNPQVVEVIEDNKN